jgi:hypothetical protein
MGKMPLVRRGLGKLGRNQPESKLRLPDQPVKTLGIGGLLLLVVATPKESSRGTSTNRNRLVQNFGYGKGDIR